MFENHYPSADNQVSSIVALLAAAEAIGNVKDDIIQGDKDIMFTFFQGVGDLILPKLQIRGDIHIILFYFSTKTYEALLMSIHNICFHGKKYLYFLIEKKKVPCLELCIDILQMFFGVGACIFCFWFCILF